MRRGETFPDGQAEVVFCDPFVEYLAGLTSAEAESVLADVYALVLMPWCEHALSNRGGHDRLAGLSTVAVLGTEHRVVFRARTVDGTGVLEVLCGGPRKGSTVYDVANALVRTGVMDADEVAQIWDALALLEVAAEQVGLDGWDFAPRPAPAGLVRAAVAAGVLDERTAAVMSVDEINAAMTAGWNQDGTPDPFAAADAALRRARTRADFDDARTILRGRTTPRCEAWMPRAHATCIRRQGHPGAHRSSA